MGDLRLESWVSRGEKRRGKGKEWVLGKAERAGGTGETREATPKGIMGTVRRSASCSGESPGHAGVPSARKLHHIAAGSLSPNAREDVEPSRARTVLKPPPPLTVDRGVPSTRGSAFC